MTSKDHVLRPQHSHVGASEDIQGVVATNDGKPWSRRGWTREELRSNWPFLTLQQVELMKEVFELFDSDGKGYFTKDELFFVMEAMGGSPTLQELDAVMYELDSNGDHVVDFPEFLTKFMTATSEEDLMNVFEQLAIQEEGEGDSNRFVTITAVARSFQYVGDALSEQDRKYLQAIFEGADKDGNGRLDIMEFTSYLERMDDELFMASRNGTLSGGGDGDVPVLRSLLLQGAAAPQAHHQDDTDSLFSAPSSLKTKGGLLSKFVKPKSGRSSSGQLPVSGVAAASITSTGAATAAGSVSASSSCVMQGALGGPHPSAFATFAHQGAATPLPSPGPGAVPRSASGSGVGAGGGPASDDDNSTNVSHRAGSTALQAAPAPAAAQHGGHGGSGLQSPSRMHSVHAASNPASSSTGPSVFRKVRSRGSAAERGARQTAVIEEDAPEEGALARGQSPTARSPRSYAPQDTPGLLTPRALTSSMGGHSSSVPPSRLGSLPRNDSGRSSLAAPGGAIASGLSSGSGAPPLAAMRSGSTGERRAGGLGAFFAPFLSRQWSLSGGSGPAPNQQGGNAHPPSPLGPSGGGGSSGANAAPHPRGRSSAPQHVVLQMPDRALQTGSGDATAPGSLGAANGRESAGHSPRHSMAAAAGAAAAGPVAAVVAAAGALGLPRSASGNRVPLGISAATIPEERSSPSGAHAPQAAHHDTAPPSPLPGSARHSSGLGSGPGMHRSGSSGADGVGVFGKLFGMLGRTAAAPAAAEHVEAGSATRHAAPAPSHSRSHSHAQLDAEQQLAAAAPRHQQGPHSPSRAGREASQAGPGPAAAAADGQAGPLQSSVGGLPRAYTASHGAATAATPIPEISPDPVQPRRAAAAVAGLAGAAGAMAAPPAMPPGPPLAMVAAPAAHAAADHVPRGGGQQPQHHQERHAGSFARRQADGDVADPPV